METVPLVGLRGALRRGFRSRRWKVALLLGGVAPIFSASLALAIVDMPVEESAEVLYRNAQFGDPAAQFTLAECYEEGRLLTQNSALAMEWYRKAAAAGYSRAEARLGERLYEGKGVPKDEKEAVRWLHTAARNGMLDAQMMMVDAYVTGRGVERNLATALIWDLITRRTLELHFGIPAGLPAKEDPKGADLTAKGAEPPGLRYIENRQGMITAIYRDDSWEAVYPFGGIAEEGTATGRRTLRDSQGNFDTREPDGSRISEETRTDSQLGTLHIRNAYASSGQRLNHRVTSENTVYEEREDGTRTLKTRLKRDDGVEVILTEQVAANGSLSAGQLRRAADGVGPGAEEVWTVQRTLHPTSDTAVEVIEKYTPLGLLSQKVLRRVGTAAPAAEATPPGANPFSLTTAPGPSGISTPAGPATKSGRAAGVDDPMAFIHMDKIEPLLHMLEKIEARAQHFAGTTEADYQHAQANAASYVIPLAMVPQNAAPIPAAVREQIVSGATFHLPEFPLVALPNDHSREVPFGVHGAELIKTGDWKHAQTEHFFVHFHGNAEAALAVQYVEGAYTILMRLLNLDPQHGPARSHIFVLSPAEWKSYKSAHNLSPQLGGFAFKTELILGASADGFARIESIHVLCHEVTHAIVARFYRDQKLPLWLNEGLADYIALRTIQAKGVLDDGGRIQAAREKIMAILAGQPDPQMDVARVFTRMRYGNRTTPDRMAAFYANSQKCVRTLLEKLPVDRFALFFNALAAGNEPNIALTLAYGPQCRSVEDFGTLVNGL